MNHTEYNVNGLRNSQIKTQLKNVLTELDGVTKVNVDMGRGSVEVSYNDNATEEDIKEKIEHIGCSIQ